MRREHHASLAADGAAVGVGYQGATEKFEESQDAEEGQDSWLSKDPADDDAEPRGGEEDGEEKGEPVSLDDKGGEAERGGEDDPQDGTGPGAGEQDDVPALVKAPFHFVHFSGPADRVCKGHSLWSGKAADEDECEQRCADLEACRFISLSSNNWCRLTSTCDSTWHQDGKKVLIFSRSGRALPQIAKGKGKKPAAERDTEMTADDEATPEPEAETTTEATQLADAAATTTEGGGTDASNTDDKASGTDTSNTDDKDNASNTTEVVKVNTTDNSTNETEVVKVNATDNSTNETEVVKVNATDNSTNETEVVKVNTTDNSNVTEVVKAVKGLVFEQQCQDQADPGIEFVNGTTATCPMLRHYCHHAQFGELVRDNCPKACGFCAVELEENSTDNKSNGTICKDGEPSELPRYEEAGHALSCTMLRHYCELDVSVKMKCKRTCGWCDSPGELVRPDTELAKANETNATNATDGDAEGWGTAYNACSRRRLLGFCHTRRRRVA